MDSARPKPVVTQFATPCAAARIGHGQSGLSVVADHIDQGFMAWDHHYLVKIWNEAYVKLLDYPPGFLRVNQPLAELLHYHAENGLYGPGDPRDITKARFAKLTGGPSSIDEFELANGRILQTRCHHPEDGAFAGIVTFTDITDVHTARDALIRANQELELRVDLRTRELRVALERAELANRAKSDFLAHMSHELRTPLNSIIGFSDIIGAEMLGPLGDPKYREYVRDIRASGQHLLDIITDILDIAKIEAGEARIESDIIDIAELIEGVSRMVASHAKRKRIDLIVRMDTGKARLLGDSLRVKQILLNLLSNAIKFTKPGGAVTLSGRWRPGGGLNFRIADTGIGIKPKDIERVMQPFGQVSNSFVSSDEGTGLGLALSKMLTEIHGGRLIIESEPGKGTRVNVAFPPERTVIVNPAAGAVSDESL